MHSPKQKLGLPIQTCGVLVLKGGVGMQDRLLHEKQRIADEAVTIAKNPIRKDSFQNDEMNQSSSSTIPGDSQHSNEHSVDRGGLPVNPNDGSVPSNTDHIPLGVPLPKPPVLPNLSQVNLHDSGSSLLGSTGQLGNDELMTDDESAADKSTMCDSKIYEISDHQKRRQCLPRMAHYKSMNPDEVIFLEAACALSSVGSDIGHVSDTKFEQSQLHSFHRHATMRAKSSRNEVGRGSSLAIATLDNDRKITSVSKKRQPLGPPPYTLQKIRKTALP